MVGVKTTFKVQLAAAANVTPQVLPLVLNSVELAPVRAILEMFSVEVPLLVSVTAWFPLLVFVV